MTYRHRLALSSLCLLLACGPGDDETTSDSNTGTATTGATTTGPTTSDATGDATSATTTTDTTPTTSTSEPATTTTATDSDPTLSSTTIDASTGDDTTTGVVPGFERFRMDTAAGPCPPNGDCDGFIELLATGMLRVEPFGEPGDPVTEAQVAPEDFDAAVAVFADAALIALLDGPDPVCDPPTDIFESMLVDLDGTEHKADTTFCAQPPVAAAREMAQSLADKYAP